MPDDAPRPEHKWVYLFHEGGESLRNLLGGKGAGVAEMTRAGMPVPPGFTITTEACLAYFDAGKARPDNLDDQVRAALAEIEAVTGKVFGDSDNPLLVSVRSGARVSMPGMMDTILNLGLNPETLRGLAEGTNDERFAQDSHRRFIQGYGSIVMGVDSRSFEEIIDEHKRRLGKDSDPELSAQEWIAVADDFVDLIRAATGSEFPSDPHAQLFGAIDAVFDSWYGKRAVDYRDFHNLPHDWGTAVNVQTMVFGNLGMSSGTGVLFTRDPNTGKKRLFGEYLLNAQGEDVVAGIRTPSKIDTLQQSLPAVYAELDEYATRLERHYGDMQDLEFTIEDGELYMLQTRAGKRSPAAAVKIALDMVEEKTIDRFEALRRVEPSQVDALLHDQIDPSDNAEPIARGLNASPGAAVGKAVFTADEAAALGRVGERVILVRPETSPDDFHGMAQSQAIVTSRGGATSHAAIVARQLGLPAVVGSDEIKIDLESKSFRSRGATVADGDIITVDGTAGTVMAGEARLVRGAFTDELGRLLEIADGVRRLEVWANADTPEEAATARALGAQGIGLCRTEHMFREAGRLPLMQEMILAHSEEERRAVLEKLLPIQRGDFHGILEAMRDLPVIVRLLDPPLHEFLQGVEDLQEDLAYLGSSEVDVARGAAIRRMIVRTRELAEANPMLGLRGCRLGIVYPEIYEMQVRAIIEAAAELQQEGINTRPEIMIPLISHINELKVVEADLRQMAEDVQRETGLDIDYKFGTMMEVPRACLTADEIAQVAEFFSFGTNDLTQTAFGISRDDAEVKFLLKYFEDGILPENPFQVLDVTGVGDLMRTAVAKGRAVKPDLEIGICGEHGGDPDSISFCHSLGLKYVSSSVYRVPVARLAAAHAALAETGAETRNLAAV